ncbi:hypothetical protein, partial [uncultured Parasutterella sp.]|uniref:hypothetical protein n=1 Tax=uncultured Parasutterella sp. TaxID=1263098 RepID=UPI0025B6E296
MLDGRALVVGMKGFACCCGSFVFFVFIFVLSSIQLRKKMERIEDKDFPFYRFKQLSGRPDIRHFVSSGRKDIGFAEAVDPAVIRRNRMELAQVVG